MLIRFWGTRGSIPTPGPDTVRFGGNTSCTEVRTDAGTTLVLDCGTGARLLGQALVEEDQRLDQLGAVRPERAVLIGHTHWDHIHGLPFFAPLFRPGRWSLYGPRGLGPGLADTLSGQMEYTYFPVTLEEFAAEVDYHELVEGTFTVGDATIRTRYLNHPALTLAYRIEADGWTVVYASDHEPHDRSLAVGGDPRTSPEDARHVEFLAGADVLIHDTQYRAEEYPTKVGWGHSTMEYVVAVAAAAGVGHLVLHHHDPSRDDDAVDALVADARALAAELGFAGTIEAAAEGAIVDRPGRAGAGPAEPTGGPDADAPAIDALADVVAVDVHDASVVATVGRAASAEGLRLVEPGILDAPEGEDRTVLVTDVDRQAESARPRPRGWAAVLGITRTRPPAGGIAGVAGFIVWPSSVAHIRAKLRAAVLREACRWEAAPSPVGEAERLAALRSLQLLDTPPEERFERIVDEARERLDVPVALVTLVDADRQWFKSRRGVPVSETPRDQSLCAHAILGDDVLQVPDLLVDDRFADNPAVTGELRLRFYAGVPLVLPDGSRVGTLCVADNRPRLLDEDELADLRRLALQVEAELIASRA